MSDLHVEETAQGHWAMDGTEPIAGPFAGNRPAGRRSKREVFHIRPGKSFSINGTFCAGALMLGFARERKRRRALRIFGTD